MSMARSYFCDKCQRRLTKQDAWVTDMSTQEDICSTCLLHNTHLLELITRYLDRSDRMMVTMFNADEDFELIQVTLEVLREEYPAVYATFFGSAPLKVPSRQELRKITSKVHSIEIPVFTSGGKLVPHYQGTRFYFGGQSQPVLRGCDFWIDEGALMMVLKELGIHG